MPDIYGQKSVQPTLIYVSANTRIDLTTVNTWPAIILACYTQGLGGFRNQKPLAKATLNTTFNVANGNDVVVPFTTGVVDTDNMYTSTVATQFTVQTPGWYRIILQEHWAASATGFQFACKIMVNGTNPNINAIATDSRSSGAGGIGTTLTCEAFAHLDFGSTIYANAFQNSGAVQTLSALNGGSFMSAEWVCP